MSKQINQHISRLQSRLDGNDHTQKYGHLLRDECEWVEVVMWTQGGVAAASVSGCGTSKVNYWKGGEEEDGQSHWQSLCG